MALSCTVSKTYCPLTTDTAIDHVTVVIGSCFSTKAAATLMFMYLTVSDITSILLLVYRSSLEP